MLGMFQNNVVQLCAADADSVVCTTPGYSLPVNDLVHLAAVSKTSIGPPMRQLTLYAFDAKENPSHVLVGSTMAAPLAWMSTSSLAVGGASAGNNCLGALPLTIDDLRLFDDVQTTNQIEGTYAASISCGTANLSAFYHFDEGSGLIAKDCVNQNELTITGLYSWVPSPFPGTF
jgi:hypothetical protein